MVSTLLSSVSSTEWLNKKIDWKNGVGVVAQSVEPLDPSKKTGVGGLGVGSNPTDSNKKVPFFCKWVVSHHANGETVSFSYPVLYLGGGAIGMWQNRVYGKTLGRQPRVV